MPIIGRKHKQATPLVLPNNCGWNEQTGECETDPDVERKTLDVQQKALDQLREIKGDVCVVSIAGFCNQGKSFILSRAFDQEKVFPLGHEVLPETMGVWLWVVPEKFHDNNGREFTVVLLDSEGIDVVSEEGTNNHSVFTLSVLLSSIMIYNFKGETTRSDLEGFDFIVQLSKRIQLHADATEQDDKHFFEVFPYLIFLLRDVVPYLPEGYNTIKEYFVTKVLNGKAEGNDESRRAAESILTFFSGFDAFSLPPPASQLQNLDDETVESQVNREFLGQIKKFKTFLHSKLSPKKSINGVFVTGEALAALVELYVEALNTPGTVPNVQNAWDTYVNNKCRDVLSTVLEKYKEEMMSQLEKKIPCEAEAIRAVDDEVMEKIRKEFLKETSFLSIESMNKYLKEMTEKTNSFLSNWLEKNRQETEKHCNQLIKELKGTIIEPILARLRSSERSKMKCGEIIAAYNKIQQEYITKDRGNKAVRAKVFNNFYRKLQKHFEEHIDNMRMLSDFNEY